ncbi:hypothetical protein D3C76_1318010 [compost metagenome]
MPGVGERFLFRRRGNERFLHEHVKHVQTAIPGKTLITREYIRPLLRREIVQYAARMQNIEFRIEPEVADVGLKHVDVHPCTVC